MVREIVTLPLRVGVSATRLGVRVTARAAGVALRITRLMIGGLEPAEPHTHTDIASEEASAVVVDVVIASSPPPEVAPSEPPAFPVATPEAGPTAPKAAERPAGATSEIPPAHVSAGLQFVESFAEPGAEQGAGAAVHVEEPWRGYGPMTANEVIARLADASPEELAAVMLYEGAHRRRKTVLAAARRELRSATAGGPAAQAGHA